MNPEAALKGLKPIWLLYSLPTSVGKLEKIVDIKTAAKTIKPTPIKPNIDKNKVHLALSFNAETACSFNCND